VTALPSAMVPRPVRVIAAHRESSDVVTLTLASSPVGRSAHSAAAANVTGQVFRPGQFNMLYAFGIGEVAISMSGDPGRSEVIVHTIRAVGAVTEALCQLEAGSVLGLRGPFGAPWPMDAAKDSDLVIVAGGVGLAPLRPAVYQALARRADYRRVFLLVGARTPEDLLFRDELEAWQRTSGITVLVTVDHASAAWKGRVGVVPALLRDVELAPDSIVCVCGPEVMMRFCVRELGRRGVGDECIYLSMERNMKCALGFCGHCQFGPSFVCKDGPVLRYDRIRSLFWSREV
jgi:NAD(P)H-flavin reductase